MASEFTRKSILNECMYNGLYAAPPAPDSGTSQIYSPSSSFLTSKTRMADQQNARNYERIMQRIRTGDRRLPSGRLQASEVSFASAPVGQQQQQQQQQRDNLYVPSQTEADPRRAHSLSPHPSMFPQQMTSNGSGGGYTGTGCGYGTSTPNLFAPQSAPTSNAPAYSSLHSRHQDFLRRRRQDNAMLGLGLDQYQTHNQNQDPGQFRSQSPAPPMPMSTQGFDQPSSEGVGLETCNGYAPADMNPAVAPYAFTGTIARPTYSVRSVPVRSIDEVRETIGIRRQYYRDKFFGQPSDQGDEAGDGDIIECVQQPEQGTEHDPVDGEVGDQEFQDRDAARAVVTEPINEDDAPHNAQVSCNN